jgi:hypothetical protein
VLANGGGQERLDDVTENRELLRRLEGDDGTHAELYELAAEILVELRQTPGAEHAARCDRAPFGRGVTVDRTEVAATAERGGAKKIAHAFAHRKTVSRLP